MSTMTAISPEILAKYQPVIGLEVHVQLLTEIEGFLWVREQVWRRAEYAYLPDVSWVAGGVAGVEPQGGGVCGAGGEGD